MVYMQWRHISMLVTSQLPIQTTKFAIIAFQRALVPPTLKKVRPHMPGVYNLLLLPAALLLFI